MIPDRLPTVAIPDLNGTLSRFHLALKHAPPESHHLILLGDIIDHGHDTPTLLAEIRDLHARYHLQLLAGNHEELMVNAVYGPPGRRHAPSARRVSSPEWNEWLNNGGQATLSSYRSTKTLLSDAEWIRMTAKRWIVRHGWLYSHASRPAPEELHASEGRMALKGVDTLLWHRPHIPHDLPSLDAALTGSVHGHTPRVTPADILGPDGKPAWFIDLGRQTTRIAIHHSDSGVRVLSPAMTGADRLRTPTLARANGFISRLARTRIG